MLKPGWRSEEGCQEIRFHQKKVVLSCVRSGGGVTNIDLISEEAAADSRKHHGSIIQRFSAAGRVDGLQRESEFMNGVINDG